MKKNKDSLNFVKTGLFECLEDYHKIKVDISRFRLVTQGEYIDIIGDSNVSGQQEEVQYENQSDVDQYKYNKYQGDIFYEIRLNQKDCFIVEDVRVVYKGSVNTICSYPEYEIDQKKGTIVVDKADITNEAYVNALKQMMKKAKEHKKISNYGTRIIMEKINEELIVLKLIHVKDFYYICNGKMWTPGGGVPDIKELMELKEKTPFSACEFDSFLSYADAIDVTCKISYTKYGQSEEVEEINDRFTCCMEFWKKLSAKNREVETHDLKMTSFEKYGMDIDKMDELAAYFAMEYFFEYDIARIQQTKRTTRISSGTETFYDILHRQNTTMEYCETLKSFFGEMSLDKIVQAYEELEKNPDKDLLDLFHSVYKGRFRTKYVEETGEELTKETKNDIYYVKKGNYQSHLYRNNQIYLGVIYQERVDQDENKNDAYIILLSEKEHYQKGKELLMSRSLPRFLFEDDSKIGMNAYEKIRKGEILDVPLAILKNNTYISSKDGEKYMHAWNDMIRMVRIVGTDPKGMLLTEVYDESI